MRRLIIYLFFTIIIAVAAMAQQLPRNLPQEDLRHRLQESKQDSNRITILFELGRTYMKQFYSEKKKLMMDSAAAIFHHALLLSDTLQLKDFWLESMLLEAEAHLNNDDTVFGKKRFFEVATIYHNKGDVQKEAQTWLRLARKMNWNRQNFAEITSYFEKSIALYTQAKAIERVAYAKACQAEVYRVSGQTHAAEKEFEEAIDLHRQIGSNKLATLYLSLSLINRYRGTYEKALLYATKSVENAEQTKETTLMETYYGELALVNDELGRVEESSYWYRKALEKRMEQKQGVLFVHRTAGFLIRQLIKLNRKKEALALQDSIMAVFPPKDVIGKATVAQNYAFCYDAMNEYAAAERNYLITVAGYRLTFFNSETYSLACMDLGRFYLKRAQYTKAKAYLDTALERDAADRLIDKQELYRMRFVADSALSNYAAAISDLQQYQFLHDSIYNEKKSKQIEELTIQYETQKKEQSIRLLENEKRLQQNELTKEQTTKRWILGVALLLIAIIGLLINNTRIKQRTNSKLQLQQQQIEKKNDSLERLVEEKEWLVKEIHHRVKNNFHMVMGLLRTQSAYLQNEEAIQAVTESQQRIQAMSLVHQKLYQSENMSAINMVDYIHELVDCLKDSFHTGHTIRFNLQIDPVQLHVSHCIPIGLILNEAITNAIKHAFPGRQEGVIDIVLKETANNHFLLSIKDNGVGLPVAFNSTKQASMGMKLMRGLSEDIDGQFTVRNNNGTEVTLSFALF